MKIRAFYLIFILIFSAHADISFLPVKQILMKGENCESLQTHAQSIMDWSIQRYNKKNLSMPACYCAENDCLMDVVSIAPYDVRELTNFDGEYSRASAFRGPNCFNSALLLTGTLPKVNFTHPKEMTGILESSLCREITMAEKTRPGDIIVIRDQSNPHFEIHAATYISDELSFSKYGENLLMPYSFGLNIEKSYQIHNPACRRIVGTPVAGDECYNQPYANHYSCSSLVSFISKLFNSEEGIPERIRVIYAEVSKLDNKISRIAFNGKVSKQEDLLQLREQVETQYQNALAIKNSENEFGQDQLTLVKLMELRAFSLLEQLKRIIR